MRVSDRGIALIREFEGFRAEPYKDIAGKWTVGFGHLVQPDEHFTFITLAEAEAILHDDLKEAEGAIEDLLPKDLGLNENQHAALVSLVFNIGAYMFAHSTLLRRLYERDFQAAAEEFPKWKFAGGRVSQGLLRRRLRERLLFLEPVEKGGL